MTRSGLRWCRRLPEIPYGGFSPIRLEGQPVRSRLTSKSWTASQPASRPRSSVRWSAPAIDWCAPRSDTSSW